MSKTHHHTRTLSALFLLLGLAAGPLGCSSAGGDSDDTGFSLTDTGTEEADDGDGGSTDAGSDGNSEDATSDDATSEDATSEDGTTDDGGGSDEICNEELAEAAIAPVDQKSSAPVQSSSEETGYTTTIEVPWGEAAAEKPWVYVRLLEGTRVPITDTEAMTSELWDMAVRGSTIRLNGGISGPAGVGAAAVDKPFADVTKEDAPDMLQSDGLVKGCAPKADATEMLQTAIGQWWTDDSSASMPSPADKTYIVERLDGDLIKLRVTGAEVGDGSATLTLRWAPFDTGPSCDYETARQDALNPQMSVSDGSVSVAGASNLLSIDASAGGMSAASNNPYVYVDLDGGQKVDVTDVEAFDDDTWDIALKRVSIRINGGDSGSASLHAAVQSASALGDVTSVPPSSEFKTDDYIDDETCEISKTRIGHPKTIFAAWYSYNSNTHALEPNDEVWVAETTEGNHVKFKINSYSGGQFEIAYEQM